MNANDLLLQACKESGRRTAEFLHLAMTSQSRDLTSAEVEQAILNTHATIRNNVAADCERAHYPQALADAVSATVIEALDDRLQEIIDSAHVEGGHA